MPRGVLLPVARWGRGPKAMTAMVLATAVLLLGVPGIGSRALAQTPEPVKFRVPITDDGWPPNLALNVEEGRTVEITFVWDQKIHLTDAHIFVIEGYNVESGEINFEHREAVLRFVANKAGTFRLKCDLECEIHDQVKSAPFTVSRAGSAPPAAAGAGTAPSADTRPKTDLLLGAPVESSVGSVVGFTANVRGAGGAPVAGAPVVLYEVAGFFDTAEQEVEVARGTTNKDGVAALNYLARRSGDRSFKAYFAGDANNASSSVALTLKVAEGGQVYNVEPPAGIPGVSRFLVSGILILVWGIMFIVSLHVVAILREGRAGEEPGDA